jgi:uncharacterized protein
MKKLKVKKSSIDGIGIFAEEEIRKGERIAFIFGTKKKFASTDKRSASKIPTWYGITKSTWMDPGSSIFKYFNHSCDPNTAIIGTKTVIARKNIKVGEEITFDYSFTDGDINWTLDHTCKCGSKRCRKKIMSIQKLPSSTVKAHYPLIPKYFLELYKRAHPNVKLY